MWEGGTMAVGTKITFVFESRMPITSERQYWVQTFLRSFTPSLHIQPNSPVQRVDTLGRES